MQLATCIPYGANLLDVIKIYSVAKSFYLLIHSAYVTQPTITTPVSTIVSCWPHCTSGTPFLIVQQTHP